MTACIGPESQASGQRGQTLVEFALVIPIFILVLVGLFDVGFLVYTNSVLSQAAREGARLGAAQAGWVGDIEGPSCGSPEDIVGSRPGAHVCPGDPAELTGNVADAVNRMAVGVGPFSAIYLSCTAASQPPPSGDWVSPGLGNGCESGGVPLGVRGDLISVRVAHTYQPITPLIGGLIGSIPLSGSATMVIN